MPPNAGTATHTAAMGDNSTTMLPPVDSTPLTTPPGLHKTPTVDVLVEKGNPEPEPRCVSLRRITAHAMAVGPAVLMWYFCVVLKLAIPAVFAFHAFIVLSLVAFCLAFGLRMQSLLPSTEEMRRSARAFARSLFSLSVGGVAVYIGCRSGSAPGEYLGVPLATLRTLIDMFGIHAPPLPYVFFSVYFTAVNPLLEEVYWRSFLHQELRCDRPWAKALVTHHYAFYHLFITSSLMPHWFSVLCAYPFLVCFGLALDRVARDERLGLVTAIGVHAGMDLAAAFWIMDLRFGWLDFLQQRPM